MWPFKAKNQKNTSENPYIKFELSGEGNVSVTCEWPTPKTKEEALMLARGYATLAFLSTNGRLLPLVQGVVHGIVNTNKEDMDSNTARAILYALNEMIMNNMGNNEPNDNLVVPPSQCFSVRGGQGDD